MNRISLTSQPLHCFPGCERLRKTLTYNNSAQNRCATCKEHDNFFGVTPRFYPLKPANAERVEAAAGLEPAYRDLLEQKQ